MTNTQELSYNDFESIVFRGVGDDYEEHIINDVDDHEKYHEFAIQIFHDQIGDDYWDEIFDSIRSEMSKKGFKTDTIYSDIYLVGGEIRILK